MNQPSITPEKITKPIQLLAAWLVGLFAINSCFLFAAANMATGSWECRALIAAAIFNVPAFLIALFLLQTRFRPELQEDSYYSTYLSQKTNKPIRVSKEDAKVVEFVQKLERIEKVEKKLSDHPMPIQQNPFMLNNLLIGVNKHLSDRNAIKEKLGHIGIKRITAFGGDTPPPTRNVSISEYLSDELAQAVIKLATDLEFDSYNFFNNREEMTEEDVLIGSYGSGNFEILKNTSSQEAMTENM